MYSSTGTEASNFVSTFNTAFYFITGVSLLLLIGLTFTMLLFVYKYNRKRHEVASQIEGNTTLEIVWTVVPVLLALTMFYFGWSGWKPMTVAPKDSMNVTGIARMWNFSFLYQNGKQSPDLVVPVNTPVKIKLISLDVIHSMFIPSFRIKSDMIPGREKMMWFLPEREGDYNIFCAEYCGLRHSYMRSSVKVLSKEKYAAWYNATATAAAPAGAAPGAAGEAIMRIQGCFACHSTDGSRIIGPSYFNLFGSQVLVVRDGKEVTLTADPTYIKRSIYDPNFEIVKGFPKGLMQPYKNTITDADVEQIIAYLKTLHE